MHYVQTIQVSPLHSLLSRVDIEQVLQTLRYPLINWPQDLCTDPSGSKHPFYDDMSNEQWVQGMILCILEENSVENKDYMLSYFSMLMQDVIELSLGTAQKAHAAVLQGMEKGKFTWNGPDLVEKCKNRLTQRMLQTVKSTPANNAHVCVLQQRKVQK